VNTASSEQVLARFSLPSQPGNERLALARVADAVAAKGLSADQLERLKTAVAETTMNAIEHGNHNRADLDVDVTVVENADGIAVSIVDRGGAHPPEDDGHIEVPDLKMKLAGLQSPRGWGLFLIRNMVDALDVSTDGDKHIVRLLIRADSPIREARDNEGGPRAEQV
jgi:anti-sigma regulatory factor (Ser/Thr protein kinase)